jgi:hypothetical protein
MNTTSAAGAANWSNAFKPAPQIFRLPLGPRLLSLFGVIVLGLVTAIMVAFAVVAFTAQWALGLFTMAVACFLAALTGYVWRDLSGKWGLQLALDADAVTLTLPAGRSLIHRPPQLHLTIPYADIESIETRLEAYGSFGIGMMQRAYVLRRKDNALIFLFEERALGTAMASSLFADIASELAARAGGKLHDLGMVEGKNGFIGVWGTHAADWSAPSLAPARQSQLWARAAATGVAAILMAMATTPAWYGGLLSRRRSRSQPPHSET